MRKRAMTLTTAFVLGMLAVAANTQTQSPGAANFRAQIQIATPIIKKAACGGWGHYCPPGTGLRCGPYRCWCARCW